MNRIKATIAAVSILAVVGAGVVAFRFYGMQGELSYRIADIKKSGDPVCGADLVPTVPDAQNGAPFYERVFAVTQPGIKEIGNAYIDVSPAKLKGHPELLLSARNSTAKYRRVIPLIEQAAARPQCAFDTNWDDPPEQITFPFYPKMRNIVKLLLSCAVVDAADGKMDDSIQDIELSYKISESLKREPALIGYLVRSAILHMTSRTLKESAEYGEISVPQARTLFDLLGKIDLKPGYVYAVKSERANGLDILERVRKNGIHIGEDGSPVAKTEEGSSFRLLPDVRACADELFYIKYLNRAVDDSEKPYCNREQTYVEPKFPEYAIMSAILMPVFPHSKLRLYETKTSIDGDRVFLSVLAYKAKFGGYPPSLRDVQEKLGWSLPSDPLADGPFHYRREGKGFVLYGVGKNMKDDNAVTVSDPWEGGDKSALRGKTDFRSEYPYSNGDGRRSADMIWRRDR